MKQNRTETARKLPRFILTRQNQKGQVAIFVALIFQVVFIFFALLINVGLLVHHKINLQHSTDLAAYYGAMKQAEGLNAIAHINFQLRQTWKLFTWRYRIFGTFGFTKTSTSGPVTSDLEFPFESIAQAPPNPSLWRYHGSVGQFGTNAGSAFINGPQGAGVTPRMSCGNYVATDPSYTLPGGGAIGPHDTPFFCVGHAGVGGWPAGETNCQLQCSTFTLARGIGALPSLSTTFNTPFGGNVASAVNTALAGVNTKRQELCERIGPVGASILARFMLGYIRESAARSQTLMMLAANLSQDPDKIVDLDGKKILDGSKRTFENNLTGANFSGLSSNSFQTYNGLAHPECRFRNGKDTSSKEFLKKIEFEFLQLFIHNCIWNLPSGASGENYKPESIFTSAGINGVFDEVSQEVKNAVTSLYVPGGEKFTIGYEKNPNCIEYYAVKTSSEPNIPFLPLSKIKLNALAIAKPFGGTIGPAFGKSWPKGNARSSYNDSPDGSGIGTKIDKTLPIRSFQPGLSITQTIYAQPNFSLFVGDRLGLRSLDYIATYHSMLAARDVGNGRPFYNPNGSGILSQTSPGGWPAFSNWQSLDDATNMQQYDSLAGYQPASAEGIREIEISAIAPNQFDIAYYSIEPDFYNNYLRKIVKNFTAISTAAGISGALTASAVRGDFGSDDIDPANDSIVSSPLNKQTFSVKDQILLKNRLLSSVMTVPPQHDPRGAGGKKTYIDILNFLVNIPSSLLTGWTFVKYDQYEPNVLFPDSPVDRVRNTMSFGQCFDEWGNTLTGMADPTQQNNFMTPPEVDNRLPNVPGNCVTGGRTGYSVKIISPSMINATNNTIENPIDTGFISF